MKLIKGTNLSQEQVRQVKAAFMYRLTAENEPRVRSTYSRMGWDFSVVKLSTDEKWLQETAFYFRNYGTLANKPHHSEPAWMADLEK